MRVKFNGQEIETVSKDTLDAVRFERAFGIAYSEAFNRETKTRIEHMCFMAWTELKNAGVDPGAFDDNFLAALEFVPEPEGAPEAAAPLDQEVQPT